MDADCGCGGVLGQGVVGVWGEEVGDNRYLLGCVLTHEITYTSLKYTSAGVK